MDKILTYLKQLYKEDKVKNLQLEFDSEYLPKCSFYIESKVPVEGFQNNEKIYLFYITCSNYRLQITTFDSVTKEQQAEMEEIYGQFVQRENRSRVCSWLSNKWIIPDVLLLEEALNFLFNPKNLPKLNLMKRSISTNKF